MFAAAEERDALMAKPLSNVEQRSMLLARMIEEVAPDFLDVVDQRLDKNLGTALRRCLACKQTALCQDWLDGRRPEIDHRDFCPNAELFEYLSQRKVANAR